MNLKDARSEQAIDFWLSHITDLLLLMPISSMGLLANSKKEDRKAQEPLRAISLSEDRYIFRELWIDMFYSYLLVPLMQESGPNNWRLLHKQGSLH